MTEPSFRAFKTTKTDAAATENHYWGLWDPAAVSLVLARDDALISYGNATATAHLLRLIHRWVDLAMPTASSFTLRVFRSDRPVEGREDEWIVKRQESQFVWSLPGS